MNKVIEQLIIYKNEFIEYLRTEKKKSPHTCASYNLDLGKMITFAQHNLNNQQTTLAHIIDHYVKIIYKDNLTKSSIARKISCYKTFIRFLSSKGIDVSLELFRPSFTEKAPIVFAMDDILQMIDATMEHKNNARCYMRERAMWELLCSTGMRCSEIVTLQETDINLDEQSVLVKDSKAIPRTLFFNQRTTYYIKEYIEKERMRYKPKEPFLFLNSAGYRLTRRAVQRSLKLLAKLLNIQSEITPHVLRHSYATYLLKNGATLDEIKTNLGLRTRDTVEKYLPYARK